MTKHEEGCPQPAWPTILAACPCCKALVAARADEREKAAKEIEEALAQAVETDPDADEVWGFWDEGARFAIRVVRGEKR